MKTSDISRLKPESEDVVASLRDEAAMVLLSDPDAPFAIVRKLVDYIDSLSRKVLSHLTSLRSLMRTRVSHETPTIRTERARSMLASIGTTTTSLGKNAMSEVRQNIDDTGRSLGGASVSELHEELAAMRPAVDSDVSRLAASLVLFRGCMENLDYSVAERYLLSRRKGPVDELLSDAERLAAAGRLREAVKALALASAGLDFSVPDVVGGSTELKMAPDPERSFVRVEQTEEAVVSTDDTSIVLEVVSGGKSETLDLVIPRLIRPELRSAEITGTVEVTETTRATVWFPNKGLWDLTYKFDLTGTFIDPLVLRDDDIDLGELGIASGDIVACRVSQPDPPSYWFRVVRLGSLEPDGKIHKLVLEKMDENQPDYIGAVTYNLITDNRITVSVNNTENETVEVPYPICLASEVVDAINGVVGLECSIYGGPPGVILIQTIRYGRRSSMLFSDTKLTSKVFGFNDLDVVGEDGNDRLYLALADNDEETFYGPLVIEPRSEPRNYDLSELAELIETSFPDVVSGTDVVDNVLVVYGPPTDSRLRVSGKEGAEEDDPSTANYTLRLAPVAAGMGVTLQDINSLWFKAVEPLRDPTKLGPKFNVRLLYEGGKYVLVVDGVDSVNLSGDGLAVLGMVGGNFTAVTRHVAVIGGARKGDSIAGTDAVLLDKVGAFWLLSTPVPVTLRSAVRESGGAASYDAVKGSLGDAFSRLSGMTSGIPDTTWMRWSTQVAATDRSESIGDIDSLVADITNVKSSLSAFKAESSPAVDSLFSTMEIHGLDRAKWFLMGLMLARFFYSDSMELSTAGLVSSVASDVVGEVLGPEGEDDE